MYDKDIKLIALGVFIVLSWTFLSPAQTWFQHQDDIYYMTKAQYFNQTEVDAVKLVEAQSKKLDDYSTRIAKTQNELGVCLTEKESMFGGLNWFMFVVIFVFTAGYTALFVYNWRGKKIEECEQKISSLEERLEHSVDNWAEHQTKYVCKKRKG